MKSLDHRRGNRDQKHGIDDVYSLKTRPRVQVGHCSGGVGHGKASLRPLGAASAGALAAAGRTGGVIPDPLVGAPLFSVLDLTPAMPRTIAHGAPFHPLCLHAVEEHRVVLARQNTGYHVSTM